METEEANKNVSNIKQFFKSRAVLITGATGFVGKIPVEKLLRDCPNLM